MNKNKHLVRSDRDTIKSMLDENCNFTQIAEAIGKARTTISREVRNRSVHVRKNTKYAIYNACKHRFSCEKKHVSCPDVTGMLSGCYKNHQGIRAPPATLSRTSSSRITPASSAP